MITKSWFVPAAIAERFVHHCVVYMNLYYFVARFGRQTNSEKELIFLHPSFICSNEIIFLLLWPFGVFHTQAGRSLASMFLADGRVGPLLFIS